MAAWLADQGKFTKEWVPYLSMAKYYATELAVKASNVSLQMLGAAGYMKDHMTELYYRDAKQLTIGQMAYGDPAGHAPAWSGCRRSAGSAAERRSFFFLFLLRAYTFRKEDQKSHG